MDTIIPTKKGLSQLNLENTDIKTRMELIDFLGLILTFSQSLNFAINPLKNKMDLIHGLIVNSFFGEDKIDEILLLINNQETDIWRELP